MGELDFTDLGELPAQVSPEVSQRSVGSMSKMPQLPQRTSKMQIFRLVHRLAVFVAAVLYVQISLKSFSTALIILRGQVSHDLPIEINLIAGYAGTKTIHESPLVQQVLGGSTTPRNNSLYLETSSAQSTTGCSDVSDFAEEIYSNDFLRFIFSRLQAHVSYNLSYISELELVVPVVDCTFDLLVLGDRTIARVYYLIRQKSDPTKVLLLSTSLSAQDYQIAQQFQRGAAMIVLIAAIDDMQATTLDHHIAVALNYPYVAEPEFAYSEIAGTDEDNYWLIKTLQNPLT